MTPDPLVLHGRPCPVCTDGRVTVTVTQHLTLISCSRCGSTGRAIAAAAGVPYSAIVAACERWA